MISAVDFDGVSFLTGNGRKIYVDFYFDDKSVVVKYLERTSDESRRKQNYRQN